MADIRKPFTFIDLTGDPSDDDEDLNTSAANIAARAHEELKTKWQPREKPSASSSSKQFVSKNTLARKHLNVHRDRDESSNEADTMDELSRTWQARSTRLQSPEQTVALNLNEATQKTSSVPYQVKQSNFVMNTGNTPLVQHDRQKSTTTNGPQGLSLDTRLETSSSSAATSCSATVPPYSDSHLNRSFSLTTNGSSEVRNYLTKLAQNTPVSWISNSTTTPSKTQSPSHQSNILKQNINGGSRNGGFPGETNHAQKLGTEIGFPPPDTQKSLKRKLTNQTNESFSDDRKEISPAQSLNDRMAALYNFAIGKDNRLLGVNPTVMSGTGPAVPINERFSKTPSNKPTEPSTYLKKTLSMDKSTADQIFRSSVGIPVDSITAKISPAVKPIKVDNTITNLVNNVVKSMLENGQAATAAEVALLNSLVTSVFNDDRIPVPGYSGKTFLADEDELLIFLKERTTLSWHDIHEYFPSRNTWNSLQTRYSKWLKPKVRNVEDTSVTNDMLETPFTPPEPDVADVQGQPRRSKRLVGLTKREITLPVPFPGEDSDRGYSSGHSSDQTDSRETSEPIDSHVHTENASKRALPHRLSRHHNVGLHESTDSNRRCGRQCPLQLTSAEILSTENLRDAAALGSQTLRISRQPVLQRSVVPLSHRPSVLRDTRRKRSSIDIQRPYLEHAERKFLEKSSGSTLWNTEEAINWEGRVLHVDFLDEEVEVLKSSICAIRRVASKDNIPIRLWAAEVLRGAPEEDISKISRHAQYRGVFLNRTQNSIDAFLRDLSKSTVNNIPVYRKLRLRHRQKPNSIGSELKDRQVGLRLLHGLGKLQSAMYNTLGPHLSLTGGSGDVTNVAWSPNGELFAAGCAALTDEHSMQYNQRNNLLLGDITTKVLRELPEHAELRKLATSGANSTREMHVSQDSLLFSSISSVQFSPDGSAMFSAGYDKVARAWDVRKDGTRTDTINDAACVLEFQHQAKIDLLAVNINQIFATGTQRDASSIKVLRYDLDTTDTKTLKKLSLSSHRAVQRPDGDIIPSCMRWGYDIYQQHKYLLCGFSSRAKEFGEGEICIWDVEAERPTAIERGARNVFDVAWSPSIFGRFAVGSTPDMKAVNRGTHSIVRIYDSRLRASTLFVNSHRTIEVECPALDMNDIVFNPRDDFLISTGCTDGSTYIWDLRNPNDLLHQFAHGHSITPLDESRPSEESDTGVRFLSWDHSHRNLYTGSSDGVVAIWNPYLSSADAHVRDLVQLNSGVMSGAFSPDFSNLLLGEVNGSVSMLSVGCEGKTTRDFEPFILQSADEYALKRVRNRVGKDLAVKTSTNELNTGIATAKVLLQNAEMELRDFGDMPVRQAVQGVRYSGPFDKAADAPALRSRAREFQAKFRRSKNPCTIQHEIPNITEEERGDSRAWQARIPERLRWLNKPDKISCAVMAPLDKFVCFRCHLNNLVSARALDHTDELDVLICTSCILAWRVNVLGYTPVDFVTHEPLFPASESDKVLESNGGALPLAYTQEPIEDGDEEDDDASDAELADVMAYHHSFWKDRSPSPF